MAGMVGIKRLKDAPAGARRALISGNRSIFTGNADSDIFNPHFPPRVTHPVFRLCSRAVPPSEIHSEQHLRPILGFCPSRSGMYLPKWHSVNRTRR